MALTRNAPYAAIAAFVAAIAIVGSTDTENLSAKTRTIGRDRIVSWASLAETNGESCEVPSGAASRVQAPLPEDAACLWSPEDMAGAAAFQRRGGGAAPVGGTTIQTPPARVIRDRFPAFSSIAVDPVRDQVVVTDENLFQILFYDRMENNGPTQIATPKRLIGTPWNAAMMKREESKTKIEFQCGLYIDPRNGEVYAVNNDTQDTLVIFSNEQVGNVAPAREIHTPHGTFGITVDEVNQEVFLTIQHDSAVVVYKKGSSGEEPPIRMLQGDRTRLADPHGVAFDPKNGLIFVTNHGSFHQVRRDSGYGAAPAVLKEMLSKVNWPLEREFAVPGSGKTYPPSITVYARTAAGDAAPLRVIEGPRTLLNWPTGIVFEPDRGELYVANDTTDSILVFDASASGNAAPRRVLKGPKTGLQNPTSVALDKEHGEMWVANFGGHTATAYRMTAQGDVAPLRTIRAAPEGTPSLMIGNPGAVAFDTKREAILVPN
jgi:DNA-binding beta-propeller fold protein YncE